MKDCNRLNKLFVSRSLLIRFLSLIFALSGFCHLDAITIGGSPPVVGHHQSWSTITITITSGGPPPPEAKMSSAEEKMLSNMDRLAVSGEFGRLGKSALNATIGIPKAFRGLQNARHGMPGTGGSHGMELGCRGGNGWCDGDMWGGVS